MATTTILDLKIKPDAVDEALQLFHRVLEETRAFDGCIGVTLIQDNADPTHLIAVEEWESLEKDTAYRKWRAGDGRIVELPGLLALAPSLSICETLSDV